MTLTNEDLGERTDPPLIIAIGLVAMFLSLVIVVPKVLAWAAEPMRGRFAERQVLISASTMKKTEKALFRFYKDHGRYPTSFEGLEMVRNTKPRLPDDAPYLTIDIPARDQWMRPYVYEAPADDGHPFVIRSFGRDGKTGGIGPDRDFTNWDWPTRGEIPGMVAAAEPAEPAE